MKKLLLIVFVLLLLGGSIVTAQTDSNQTNSYVSLNGKFYIEYPSDWKQIPYTEVDAYLSSKKAGRPLYDYDAVFASNESNPFYTGSYFIMSVEKVGNLSDKQIDSVLHILSQNFGKGIKYFPVANFLADIKTNSPNYDKDSKTVTIYNKIVQNETSIKNSLIIMKFYDFGIATFYCYALGDAFETDKEIFSRIAASLSTEDLQSKLPKEELKIAEIDTTQKTTYETEDEIRTKFLTYMSISAVFLLLVIIIFNKRRKKH